MALILRLEDLNQEQGIKSLNTNKVDITTHNAAMNDVNSKLQTIRTDLNNGVADAKKHADDLVNALKTGDVKKLQDAVAVLNGDSKTEGSVDAKISAAVEKLIGGAKEDLDTLKEIIDYFKNEEVSIDKLIDAVNGRVDALIGKASDGYKTLEAVEARIKEVIAAQAADKQALENSIANVQASIPVYAFEKDLTLSDKHTVTLSKVPFGDVMNGDAVVYYNDANGNIVEIFTVTVGRNADDKTGKVYDAQISADDAKKYADQLKSAKAMLSYFWRPIDNK